MSETSDNAAGFGTFEEEIERAKRAARDYEAAVADECAHFRKLIRATESAGELVSGNAHMVAGVAVVGLIMETQAAAASARAMANRLQAENCKTLMDSVTGLMDIIKQAGTEP